MKMMYFNNEKRIWKKTLKKRLLPLRRILKSKLGPFKSKMDNNCTRHNTESTWNTIAKYSSTNSNVLQQWMHGRNFHSSIFKNKKINDNYY